MRFEVFSSPATFPAGLPVGGYGVGYHGRHSFDPLEINGISWQSDHGPQMMISLDALYAGAFKSRFGEDAEIVASHTHFAPMTDRQKPQLGHTETAAIDGWQVAFETAKRHGFENDEIRHYYSEVGVPLYRRYDHKGALFGRFVNRYCGMYPNDKEPIDKGIHIFGFCQKGAVKLCMVWHCCHPVSRPDRHAYSADYIGVIRAKLRQKFGQVPVIFINGPSGDIRPGIVEKRISFLPAWGLNRKFSRPCKTDTQALDQAYGEAIETMSLRACYEPISPVVSQHDLHIEGYGALRVKKMLFAQELGFCFLPFEVSHRYHRIGQTQGVFIASLANDVLGYLPHQTQLGYGGYEVDSSRPFMGLKHRVYVTESEFAKCLTQS